MRQQDRQKRMALLNMTEDQSPFKLTKTQTIFKNAANVSLRGSTFDATHLDKFLDSDFGEKSMIGNIVDQSKRNEVTNRTGGPGGGGGSNLMSYLSNNTNSIRPSISFISMNRDEYKMTEYPDLMDGPSPMQILGNEKALKDKFKENPTMFEKERDDHNSVQSRNISKLNTAKNLLYAATL